MTKNSSDAEPVSGFFAAGGGKRGAMIPAAEAMAQAHATMRRASPVKTARARIDLAPTKTKRAAPKLLGPTPERIAKGDIPVAATAGGFHRSVPPIERLRDQNKLDHDSQTNQAMFEAAEKLYRHFQGCMVGVKAQDLNRVIGGGGGDDLTQEESWVHHFDQFKTACKLMGWFEGNPHRGAGRIVVAVVCYEMTIRDAGAENLPAGRVEGQQITAMDRIREGLFGLAKHWRMA